MAEARTQDTQKVFNSATKNFVDFVNGVKPNSHSKDMEQIYANMEKMFSVFTKGVLTGQGSNSEQILRTIYKSLDEDFIDIIQNTNAVDKIIEYIKNNQEQATTSDSSMITQTTKKVVTQTLDPVNCDISEVMTDFLQEIQSSVLVVRRNLVTELAKQRLAMQKTYSGQEEDLTKLTSGLAEQGQQVVDNLPTIEKEDEEWKNQKIKKLEELIKVFNSIGDQHEKELSNILKNIDGIKIAASTVQPKTTPPAIKPVNIKNLFSKISGQGSSSSNNDITDKEINTLTSEIDKVSNIDVNRVIPPDMKPAVEKKETKLKLKPSKNGMVCPLCGSMVDNTKKSQKQLVKPQTNNIAFRPVQPVKASISKLNGGSQQQDSENDISSAKVQENLGIINTNIGKLVKNQKFQKSFMLNYPTIQKAVGKQMKRMQKDEGKISSELNKTKWGIRMMKVKSKASAFMSLILGGLVPLAFIAIGGLILIMLLRVAFNSWAQKYLPPSDGTEVTLFGIPIPGFALIKQIALGLYNTIRVGIPNLIDTFIPKIEEYKKLLFGKKGMFANRALMKITFGKIFRAIIIANTKKAGGAAVGLILKILGKALNFIPGVGPVISFLIEFAPAIYTAIANLISSMWGNAKANAEANFADLSKNLKKNEIRQKLLAASKKINTFVPTRAIPGLQTPKPSRNMGGKPGAIMRHVALSTEGRQEYSEQAQKKQLEEQNESGADIQHYKDKKTAGANVNMMAENSGYRSSDYQYDAFGNLVVDNRSKRMQAVYQKVFAPQFARLDDYINDLKGNQRFMNVTGPLYDGRSGWNAGYRVVQSDLMSPIPLIPFEEIHTKADVPIGQPDTQGDESYIGIQPFTWFQSGNPVVANPIKWELSRAVNTRELLEKLWKKVANGGWFSYYDEKELREDLIPDLAKDWRAYNMVNCGEYDDDDGLFAANEFPNFLKKFRSGQIDVTNNTLETAVDSGDKSWTYYASGHHLVDTIADGGKKVGKSIKKAVVNVRRALSYDKSADVEEDDSSDSLIGAVWNWGKKQVKKAVAVVNSGLSLNDWRKRKFGAFKYGDVRNALIDGGILDAFENGGTIIAPLSVTNNILSWFIKNKLWKDWGDTGGQYPYMSDLIAGYMFREGITGYQWDNMKDDAPSLAAFATLFLQYLGTKVIPAWNESEEWLSYVITNNGDKTSELIKSLTNLHNLLHPNTVVDFMEDYLRFPNIKTTVVDLTNATDSEASDIKYYMHELGILTQEEKEQFLNDINSGKDMSNKFANFAALMNTGRERGDIEKQQDKVDKIRDVLAKAKYESKFTGELGFVQSLTEILEREQKKLDEMKYAEANGGTKIVQTVNGIRTEVINPPKTPEEIEAEKEAERKKQEEIARQAEEKRKQEEEQKKKELEEKAKRAEAVAIAQAKIEKFEAIRKQDENYEAILEKMVGDPGSVTDEDLNSVKDDIDKIKQEAENRIAQMPREERELKLALIRGDKVSPKTFKELRDTAVGLHGNLQEYIAEVNKIPCGSVVAVNNQAQKQSSTIQSVDADSVDLGS